ncbi:hypothetical protein CB1_001418006 [Camelus ferus]|nr:hypothetical protein CB1_001418006 [Camelus ferus]
MSYQHPCHLACLPYLERVGHNHSKEKQADFLDKQKSRDEHRARAMKIAFTNHKIINLPAEELRNCCPNTGPSERKKVDFLRFLRQMKQKVQRLAQEVFGRLWDENWRPCSPSQYALLYSGTAASSSFPAPGRTSGPGGRRGSQRTREDEPGEEEGLTLTKMETGEGLGLDLNL